MTRAPVLFRVDAGPRQGWEAMWRCMTFAAALQRRRRSAYLLAQTMKRGGNEWLEADAPAGQAEDLEETIQEIRRLRPAAVILDAPDIGHDYLCALRETGVAVISIDTLAATAFPSHLVINPLLGPGKEAYEIQRGTQVLLGSRYAVVRPEIRRIRPIRARGAVSRSLCGSRSAPSKNDGRWLPGSACLRFDRAAPEELSSCPRPHPLAVGFR